MENNLILYVGVIGAILSPLVTLAGLWFSHRVNLKNAEIARKKADAEAEKLEAETDKLNIESNTAQITYYISIVENLRKEVGLLYTANREHTDKIANLEMRLAETEREKKLLLEENAKLRSQVNAQEEEIVKLRNKVQVLENNNAK